MVVVALLSYKTRVAEIFVPVDRTEGVDEAKRNGARVPVTALVDQFYADVQAMGGSRFDTSSLIKRLR